jgi:pyrophosphatase PpaX
MNDRIDSSIIEAQIPFEALLWDVDGTLIDTTALIVGALDATLQQFTGKTLPTNELRALIGIPLDQQMRIFGDPKNFGTTAEIMAEGLIRHYERRREQERPVAEAIDALIYCKRQGIKTALVTSKSDAELANTLPRLGISAYCDVIISADQVAPNYKPHPRPVQLALDRLGVSDPRRAIFIGDSIYDIQSGKAAGTLTAAVLWGAATEATLRQQYPDFLIFRPEDLLAEITSVRAAA